jgi:hypothetical protein
MCFKCNNCGRKFQKKETFINHQHVDCDPKFVCVKCDHKFHFKKDLDRHIARVTPCVLEEIVVDENTCNRCFKNFSTHGNLTRHLKICPFTISNVNNDIKRYVTQSKIQDKKIEALEKELAQITDKPKVNEKFVYSGDDDEFEELLRRNKYKSSQWVYFIHSNHPSSDVKHSMVKIGLTKCMITRLKELQTGSPYKLKIIGYIETDNMNVLEKEFHNYLAECRNEGEWFNLSKGDVYSILDNYRVEGTL